MSATISKIEVFSIGMPLVGTFTSGGVSKSLTKCVVVRITASDGVIGISSIDPSSTAKSPHTGPELALAIRDRIGPALIGKDPGQINQICEMASKLAPTQREALLLAVVEGLPYETIAAHTNVSVGTVKSRISRARDRLEHLLIDGDVQQQSADIADGDTSTAETPSAPL